MIKENRVFICKMEVILSRSQREEKKVKEVLALETEKLQKKITVQGEVSWTLSNGILRVSAQGKMPDYGWGENAAPWKTQEKEIRKVIINAGVTYR